MDPRFDLKSKCSVLFGVASLVICWSSCSTEYRSDCAVGILFLDKAAGTTGWDGCALLGLESCLVSEDNVGVDSSLLSSGGCFRMAAGIPKHADADCGLL